MNLNDAFRRNSRRTLRNICKQQGFDMKRIKGKRYHWLVVDAKKRHHAMSWAINYDKGSGYFVVRFPEGNPGNFGPARFSLRSDSQIADFCNVIKYFSRLRAKRQE